jgi:hypothetical protein
VFKKGRPSELARRLRLFAVAEERRKERNHGSNVGVSPAVEESMDRGVGAQTHDAGPPTVQSLIASELPDGSNHHTRLGAALPFWDKTKPWPPQTKPIRARHNPVGPLSLAPWCLESTVVLVVPCPCSLHLAHPTGFQSSQCSPNPRCWTLSLSLHQCSQPLCCGVATHLLGSWCTLPTRSFVRCWRLNPI